MKATTHHMALISLIKELEFEIKSKQAQLASLQQELKDDLQEDEQLTYDGVTLVQYPHCQRSSIDAKALQQAHPVIYAQFVKTTDYRRLIIK